MQTHTPKPALEPELPLDHAPALEAQMRDFYDSRWKRWHKAGNFDAAMTDPVTRKCLALAVQHLPHNRKGKRK